MTALQEELVRTLLQREGIGERVAQAFRAVPRHVFLPGVPLEEVYSDEAIVTKRDAQGLPISSSSQPAIMALMLEQLAVEPGHRVLEIGAGTGFNAALLAHLTGPAGEVVSVDLDQDLIDRARLHLRGAAVTLVCGDGALGYAPRAPYDRLIATVGVWDLAPDWLEQLAPGGRLVVPLDVRGVQVSVAMERGDGCWSSRSVTPCGFMRMRGPSAGPEQVRLLDLAPELTLFLAEPHEVGDVLAALDGPVAEVPLRVRVDRQAYSYGLGLWVAARDPRSCTLSEGGRGRLSAPPVEARGFGMTSGLAEEGGLAVLSTHAARGYGPAGARLAAELAEHVRAWEHAGRPRTEDLRIDAYPGQVDVPGTILVKRDTTLALSWLTEFTG